ncbi:hypothetical protein Dsin_018302 [Dipteronia sinensis]|uniref:Reverse transcriptase domain-containing protein n=1 Tax=Dipteronia sinensis TaxID=43782 RepID=A0AAE0A6K4_9ROSI|nr:hypothetical protein Dsin_018302 [Dipteronia sinensis]
MISGLSRLWHQRSLVQGNRGYPNPGPGSHMIAVMVSPPSLTPSMRGRREVLGGLVRDRYCGTEVSGTTDRGTGALRVPHLSMEVTTPTIKSVEVIGERAIVECEFVEGCDGFMCCWTRSLQSLNSKSVYFREALEYCNLDDRGFQGSMYTWCNKHNGDHRALMIDLAGQTDMGWKKGDGKGMHFHFEAYWADEGACRNLIKTNWVPNLMGNGFQRTVSNICNCTKVLGKWNRTNRRKLTSEIQRKVRAMTFAIASNKAPRLDGLPGLFYHKFWDVFGPTVTTDCLQYMNNSCLLETVNDTLVVLIPKIKNPVQITGFQPISLCNVIYKVVANSCKPPPPGPNISHLFFDDNSLLFSKATKEECRILRQLLDVYFVSSSHEINYDKSIMCFSKNISWTEGVQLASFVEVKYVKCHERCRSAVIVTAVRMNSSFETRMSGGFRRW